MDGGEGDPGGEDDEGEGVDEGGEDSGALVAEGFFGGGGAGTEVDGYEGEQDGEERSETLCPASEMRAREWARMPKTKVATT